VGKWFSHEFGMRLLANGGTMHPFFSHYDAAKGDDDGKMEIMQDIKYISGRLDFMLNLTNLFRTNKENRFYNLVPYVGGGYIHTMNPTITNPYQYMLDGRTANSFLVGGGVLNTFRLSHHVDLYVNLGTDLMKSSLDGSNSGYFFKTKYNGLSSGAIGLIYKFGAAKKVVVVPPPTVIPEAPKYALNVVNGKGSGKYEAGTVVNIAANCSPDTQTFDRWTGDVNNVSNVNSANTTYTMGSSNATITAMCKDLPPKVEPAPVKEPVKATLDPVFFRLDKSVVDPSQESKIKAAADYLNANPNAILNVVGHADAQTANPKYNMALSQRRTNAVANRLVKKYGISKDRLKLDSQGDTNPPFAISVPTVRTNTETIETQGTNEMNRVVMFIQ
jgi:outer membrane protein OmpA-like peptidoglycan-associated protein